MFGHGKFNKNSRQKLEAGGYESFLLRHKTKQNKKQTNKNKTRQNKTKQNKTKQKTKTQTKNKNKKQKKKTKKKKQQQQNTKIKHVTVVPPHYNLSQYHVCVLSESWSWRITYDRAANLSHAAREAILCGLRSHIISHSGI